MALFTLFSDSSADLSADLIKKHDIQIITFGVTLDGLTYFRDGVDKSHTEFFEILSNEKVFPKTSTPSIADYADAFTPALQAGQDVVCVCLSSGFSASSQSALNAKSMLEEEYPERQIHIVDSRLAAAVQGLLVLNAAKLRDEGKTAAETAAILDDIKQRSKVYLTMDSLEYLQRGGRIGKGAAFAGTLLNIKPILAIENGVVAPKVKARGRKKALSEMLNFLLDDVRGNESAYDFVAVYAANKEECEEIAKNMRETHGLTLPYDVWQLGATIGAHAGPTVVGVGYVPKV